MTKCKSCLYRIRVQGEEKCGWQIIATLNKFSYEECKEGCDRWTKLPVSKPMEVRG